MKRTGLANYFLLFAVLFSGCTLPSQTRDAQPTALLTVNDGDVIDLTADIVTKEINGVTHKMYAYNGMIPGVSLKTTKGSRFTVNFHNNLDTETTIHWHGLRHENKDDGVPGVTQEPVRPGDTYTYTVYAPDAGIFWYHPHIREDLQQDLGLAGNLLVTTQDQPAVNREEILVLDDILIEDNQIVPHGTKDANFALMGRFGNVFLVNGQTDYAISVNVRDVVRFYLTNVANARPFNISFANARMKLVGTDLSMYEKETFVDSVTISPGERYTVDVLFDHPGESRLVHTSPENTILLGTIPVSPKLDLAVKYPEYSTTFNTLAEHAEVLDDIDRFRPFFDNEPNYTFDLTVDMPSMPARDMQGLPCHQMPDGTWMGDCDNHQHAIGTPQPIEWEDDMGAMNRASTSKEVTWILKENNTGRTNMNFSMNANVGGMLTIRLFNDPASMHPMQHPIHLHGQRFLVLAENGKKNQNLAWKDTVLVPTGSTVDILVDAANPGTWMLHCHIAEHLTAGMMTSLVIQP